MTKTNKKQQTKSKSRREPQKLMRFEFRKWRDNVSRKFLHDYAIPLARYVENSLQRLERAL